MDIKWLAIMVVGASLAAAIGGGLESYNKRDCWKLDQTTGKTWNSCTGEVK